MSVKELRGITPTFQAVLNKQIAKTMDAIDDGDYSRAYSCLRTLIFSLNPKHKKDLMENDVAHINTLIFNARRQKTIERYDTKRRQYQNINSILKQHILGLFDKVMTVLHKGGYLETYLQPRAKTSGRLKV